MAKKIITLLLAFISISCFSVTDTVDKNKIFKVGVTNYPPFAIINGNSYSGIVVDVWRNIARNLNLKYKFVELGANIDENVKALKNKKIDILAGPATMSYQRTVLVAFTRPYAINHIGFLVPIKHQSLSTLLKTLLKDIISLTVLFAIILIFTYTNLAWYFERKHIPNMPQTYFAGIGHLFWATILGSKIISLPKTYGGRFIQFLWVSGSTAILSVIYATVITAIHSSYNASAPLDPGHDKIAAREGGVGNLYAKQEGFITIPVPHREAGVALVLNGKAQAYADYNASSDYYIKKNGLTDVLQISDRILKISTLGIGVPVGSSIIHDLNTEIAYMEENGAIQEICTKYLGSNLAAKTCL